MKINSISPLKHKYLQIIDTIAKKPAILHYIGTLPDDRTPTVAIIGTRKPTTYGREVTYQLAYDLAKRGVVIISGLALGTDGIAHQAALDAGGRTIAVLASSIDDITPHSHRSLGEAIIKRGGAIISEYEPGAATYVAQFLARNRIVSGLSDAVVVTEASARSGTLATVTFALDQGREVFAVPGNITSPSSAGSNTILKQGGHPVTRAEDILEIIAPHLLKGQSILPLGDTPLESRIISLIQLGVRDGDELHAQSHATISDFSEALTMLEINSVVRALGGNQWTLR